MSKTSDVKHSLISLIETKNLAPGTVSYTHLDVYKRQVFTWAKYEPRIGPLLSLLLSLVSIAG